MEIDSGAGVSLMSKKTFEELLGNVKFNSSSTTLRTISYVLLTIGEAMVLVQLPKCPADPLCITVCCLILCLYLVEIGWTLYFLIVEIIFVPLVLILIFTVKGDPVLSFTNNFKSVFDLSYDS